MRFTPLLESLSVFTHFRMQTVYSPSCSLLLPVSVGYVMWGPDLLGGTLDSHKIAVWKYKNFRLVPESVSNISSRLWLQGKRQRRGSAMFDPFPSRVSLCVLEFFILMGSNPDSFSGNCFWSEGPGRHLECLYLGGVGYCKYLVNGISLGPSLCAVRKEVLLHSCL